jgi:hypothetical protein
VVAGAAAAELGEMGDQVGGGAAIGDDQLPERFPPEARLGARPPFSRLRAEWSDRLPRGAAVRMVPAMSANLRDRDA